MALLVGQRAVRLFGGLEQGFAGGLVVRVIAVGLQPELHVGETGDGRDVNLLLEPELLRRHRAVHPVREPGMALFLGLDNRRRMHAGGRAEGVGAHHGIVDGNRNPHRLRHGAAILGEPGEVVPVGAEQLEVDDQQVHLGIAHPLPYAERGGMHAVHPGLDGRQAVD